MSNVTSSVMPSNSAARTKRFFIRFLEYFALLLASFIALLPLISSFMISFKTAQEYGSTNAMTPPQNWLNFDNYIQVWNEGDMLRAFLTSAGVVVVVVLVSVMMGSMLAYVLNRFRFPGNNLIRNLFMIATLIPGIAMQVTTYQIMKDLGLDRKVLFVFDEDEDWENAWLSMRNLPEANFEFANSVSCLELANTYTLVCTEAAVNKIQEGLK